jgi:hypothetical protein
MDNSQKTQLFNGILSYGIENKKSKRDLFSALLKSGQFDIGTSISALNAMTEAGVLEGSENSALAPGADPEIKATQDTWKQTGGDWASTVQQLSSQGYVVAEGSKIDNELRRINKLNPIIPKTVAQIADETKAVQEQSLQLADAQEKVSKIEEIQKAGGIGGAVGPNALVRWSLTSKITGKKQNFIAGVENLISEETMDALLNLKQAGGTLGALSDQERIMLAQAASKIGSWRVTNDSGKVVGYNASEADFNKELERLKALAQKAIIRAGGNSDNTEQGGSINEDLSNNYRNKYGY